MSIEKFGKGKPPSEQTEASLENSKRRWFAYLERNKGGIPKQADGVIITTQEKPGAPGVYYLWMRDEGGGHTLMRLADGFKPNAIKQGIVDESGQLTRTFEPAYAIQFAPDGRAIGDFSELANLQVSGELYYYDTHRQLEGVSKKPTIENHSE